MAIVGTSLDCSLHSGTLALQSPTTSVVLDSDLPQFVETPGTELCLAFSPHCHLKVLKGRKPGDRGPHFMHFSKIQTDVSYVVSSFLIAYHQLLHHGSHFVL